MKKINLIEWLSRNSHEKQSPQRFGRYAVMLLMLLTIGVGQMWAGNNCTYQNCYFYFNPYYDATHTVNKGSVQIAARKYQNVGQDDYGWYTAVTSLNNVTNTRLYYTSSFNGPNWSDAGLKFHGWAMISNSSAKSDGETEYWKSGNSTWYSEFKNYGLNSGNTYLFEASSSSNGQTIETTTAPGYLSSGWLALNKTITVKAKISTDNGSSYSEATSPATLTASSYKFTAHNTCTTSTSLSSGSIVCGYTATTTLTAPSTDPTGYTWVGWYNASGTQQTTSKTLTIYPTANATYYAYYTAIQYGGTIDKNGGASNQSYTATYGVGTLTIAIAPSRAGYQLNGYYEEDDCTHLIANTSKALQNSTSYTTSGGKWNYTSAPDLYAGWTPNTYKVSFSKNGGSGDAMSLQNFTYDVAQNLSTNTYTRTGYTFDGWATSSGGSKVYNDGQSVSNLTTTNNGTYPLYAHWEATNYTVTLDIDEANHGTIDGKATSASVTFDAAPTAIAAGQLPTAAQGYAFMGFYSEEGGNGRRFIDPSGNWVTDAGDTISSGNWVKPAGITLYAYYKKAEITALTLDNAVVAPSGTVGVTPTVAPTPEGTNSICWKLLYSNGNLYSPQPTFSPTDINNKVTFDAPSTSGTYLIAAVLRTGNECNGGTKLDSVTSAFQVAGDHTVTVQYKCGDEVIRASASVTGKPLEATEITAPDIVGYTFSKWKAGDGITIEGADSNGENTSATINFTAIYDGKLTAIYTKKQMIYFNNTLEWEDVWVYFYNDASGNKYWANNYGTGANKQQYFNGNAPYYEQEHGHMTQIEGTDIWYFDFKAAGYNTTRTKVAFVNKDQSIDKSGASNDEAFFHNASVIYRDDFDATNLPMFVPIDAVEYDYTANTGSKYYRGYWMNYPESTGYTLKIYNKKTDDGSAPEEIRSIPFEFTADKTMPMELDVDLEAGKTYGFKIYCNNDTWLGNNGTMTATTPNWELSAGTSNCGLTTTAAGNYKFTLNYFAVSSTDYKLRIGVTYPVAAGDYQVLYKDDTMSKWFISAVVPAASDKDTVSFFVRKDENPVLKLQKCGSVGEGAVTWSDTVANLISVLPSAITQDSVYIFCLNKNAEGKRELGDVKAYTGNYYIRTDCAGTTKWDNYRAADHLMTYSEYSEKNSDFTHYFVAHVNSGSNVKYVIANDYSPNISDTLAQQDGDVSVSPAYTHVNTDGFLQANANIRFMWNRHNNNVVRAYLADAQTDGLEFLVLRANSSTDMTDADGNALLNSANSGQAGYNHKAPDNSIQFTDKENWIYEANIKIKPGAFVKLYAKFDNGYFYFKGVNNNTFDASNAIQLMEGTGDLQKVRVVFDFKTDRLLAAWVPEDATIATDHKINADVMFVREGQGDIAQLTFESSGKISAIKSAYGVMRFNKWTLNNKEKTGSHGVLDDPKSIYERSLFWISFPFKVKLNDIFGFGTYGTHWAIQKYNGARRASEGFWAESSGFWEWMNRTDSLMPNQGYLLAIDLDLLGEDNTAIWGPDSRSEQIELYFPSYGTMPDITNANVEHTLPSHECTIDWSGRSNGNGGTLGSAYNRTVIDSHWNVMSVPTYVNTSNVSFANDDWIAEADGIHGPNFLYTWNASDNTLTPTAGEDYHYHAMHAYMVQYHGDVTWEANSGSLYPSIVARRTYAEQPKKVNFCLEIQQNEKMIDRTFVQLSDDEEVSADFSFGEDMGKEFNSRKANIYTVIEGYLQAAGNTLPMSDQTTLVPVGVKTTAAGEYTFAMPDGTNGVSVVLIDNIAGTRTNLALSDYTVSLGKGDLSDRFMLEIAPIKQMPTDVELLNGGNGENGVRKVLIDGLLYIVKDGKVFDARGAKVK